MHYLETLKYSVAAEPSIVADSNGSFVIVGSQEHGMQIPQPSVVKLIHLLNGVEALKMEGEGTQSIELYFHPMSPEVLAKACVGPDRTSWISESNGKDIGQRLSEYGVPEGIMEVFIPAMNMRMNKGISDGFFQALPGMFEQYKVRFGFLDVNRGVESFLTVANYWGKHGFDAWDLMAFSYEFEMFMGNVLEYECWRPDLRRFREDHTGKIGVVCGSYHIPFVQPILERKDVEKPSWEKRIDKNNDPFVVNRREQLKGIQRHIEIALSGTL